METRPYKVEVIHFDKTLSALNETLEHQSLHYYPNLEKVLAFVHSHIGQDITLAEAARIAGYERSYFCSLFHRKTGIPFKQWLTGCRVAEAARILTSKDHPISQLAGMVGFGSARSFGRAFKTTLGITPRAFARTVRPESQVRKSGS
jgi:transcriptional regulator GlxA family with amidase domain